MSTQTISPKPDVTPQWDLAVEIGYRLDDFVEDLVEYLKGDYDLTGMQLAWIQEFLRHRFNADAANQLTDQIIEVACRQEESQPWA